MEEPGGLQSMGSRLSDFTFTFMHWRRKWPPTPVFLPGESQGRGSLVGCRLWGRTESDTTEVSYQSTLQLSHCTFHTNELLPAVSYRNPYPSEPHSNLTAFMLLPQCNPFFHIFVSESFAFVKECFTVLFLYHSYLRLSPLV